jgi:hypothetical protein
MQMTEEELRKDIDSINWIRISASQKLSEDFIREFAGKVDWVYISYNQTLSEDFIREFADKVNWNDISAKQKLSEEFIREFADKLNWQNISAKQKLSEEFIREFADKVDWFSIPLYQKLSEEFIFEFKNNVIWHHIETCQNLSEEFRTQHNMSKAIVFTKEQKLENMHAYAKEFNLKIENDTLFAYREHDKWNHGVHNKTIIYDEIDKKYEDWHCNLDSNIENSFGLGVFPKGNIKVSVHVDDWGVWVNNTDKGRVWAFTLLSIVE